MNASTIAVHWHDDNQPVYSVHFQPCETSSARLASAGGDNNVRIWKVKYGTPSGSEDTTVEYLSTLRKHTQAVNAVRFDPNGRHLATAGDDGLLILWTLSDHIVLEFGHQDDEVQESWVVKQVHTTNLEIYDISWSPDSRYIATGSTDNITKIYDITTGQKVTDLADHSHYVQGVAWDPRNEYLATQSADRTMHVYLLKTNVEGSIVLVMPTLFFKIVKAELPASKLSSSIEEDSLFTAKTLPPEDAHQMNPPTQNFVHQIQSSSLQRSPLGDFQPAVRPSSENPAKRLKRFSMYHSESLQSFFRRLAFSPDGSLLLTPLGVFKNDEHDGSESTLNTVYIYVRLGLNKPPVCHLPGLSKPAVAIAFSPLCYQLSGDVSPVFDLPYRMIFAVATQDSVIIYDTEHLQPLGLLSNLHYLTITDLSWNADGQSVMVSSAEGFCSLIAFDSGVFGKVHKRLYPNGSMSIALGTETSDSSHDKVTSAKPNKLENTEVTTGPARAEDRKPEATEPILIESDLETTNSHFAAPSSGEPEPTVTSSLLTQFMATPVEEPAATLNVPASIDENAPVVSEALAKKKRRIAPTLLLNANPQ